MFPKKERAVNLTLVKIGGNVVDDEALRRQFLEDFARLSGPKILVHGGGKIATQVAARLGIETQLVEGRRITDGPMLDVVTMVYGGLVNRQLVASLQTLGCDALGLTGADAGLISAHQRTGWAHNYGFVGDIDHVREDVLADFLDRDLTPVLAPLTFDKALGSLLNTNADTQAQTVAVALSRRYEVNLVYCFEKKGVLLDPADDDSVLSTLTPATYAGYRASGVISGGMIPKLDNAFTALRQGLRQVTICHASQLQAAVAAASVPATTAGTRLHL